MDELLATLEKIQDASFVTTICVDAPMTNLATTKRILSYAKERLARATQVGRYWLPQKQQVHHDILYFLRSVTKLCSL